MVIGHPCSDGAARAADFQKTGALASPAGLAIVGAEASPPRAQSVEIALESAERPVREVNRLGALAGRTFLAVEVLAYIVLGSMLAVAVMVGVAAAAVSLWGAIQASGETEILVLAVDRLLFVLMVVEVMHTVRVSFRSGKLVCEPFLIVGLIASIRRVLVITLESSQAHQPGEWGPNVQAMLNSTMLELAVLAGLILVMVVSIVMLRLSDREGRASAKD
jgi:uncharacterized membrane protein (DUF373 family)